MLGAQSSVRVSSVQAWTHCPPSQTISSNWQFQYRPPTQPPSTHLLLST